MPKRRYHIYYRFDAKTQVIVIYTLPPLPTGWHGVLEALTGSVVFVHP